LRVVFAGTPAFAATALRSLCEAGFDLPLVLTQPDRPAGRGMQVQASPVKLLALERGLALAQPRSLRLDGRFAEQAEAAREALTAARADVMVVAAYGLILPQWVLDLMRHAGAALGCINIHASLLPRWRGAAPIHRAIEAGDQRTGVSIMQMDAGLDTGDILLEEALPIRHAGPDADTTGSLHDKLASLGATMVVRALTLAAQGRLAGRKQLEQGVTYARKVDKADALVDWQAEASLVERRVRAFHPTPGAWTWLGADVVKLWRAEIAAPQAWPVRSGGTVLEVDARGITVACGQGAVRLLEVQRAGGKRVDAAAFARGQGLRAGSVFAPPAA